MFKSFQRASELAQFHITGTNRALYHWSQLQIIERTNPCGQAYYLFVDPQGESLVITYEIRLNLLTFSRLQLRLPVTIVGLPLSVARAGYLLDPSHEDAFFNLVKEIKGFKLILNAQELWEQPAFGRGFTLPSCKLKIEWSSFEDYIRSMRSGYRYRCHSALKKWAGVTVTQLESTRCFDEELYQLYLQVYEKSIYKLEKLDIGFFQQMPATILVFKQGLLTLGFAQLLEDGKELIFLFGGLNYQHKATYDIYMNMLLEIVKYAIQHGYQTLDLGQTAEDTKLKLGCQLRHKYMYVHHSNAFINYILKKLIKFFDYQAPDNKFSVFRER